MAAAKRNHLSRPSGRKSGAANRRTREIDANIRTKSLWELAAPLTKALQGLSEQELDALVEKARRSKGTKSK